MLPTVEGRKRFAFDASRIVANPHSWRLRLLRALWTICYSLLYRPTPNVAHRFRVLLLTIFGANVHPTAHPYPKCRIWAPWRLKMAAHSCLANYVDCYNVAPIQLDELAIVSQYSYLCSATHDFNHPEFPLISQPIRIERHAWIAARAYIGPGVTVQEGAVVGANACVYKDVAPWTVVGGNPAQIIGHRCGASK
jgi:putative colanic acid biosynthesis acetyltransferase WcaF